MNIQCPKCGSHDIQLEHGASRRTFTSAQYAEEQWPLAICNDCGWEWNGDSPVRFDTSEKPVRVRYADD